MTAWVRFLIVPGKRCLMSDVMARFALWRCQALGWHPQRFRVSLGFDGASEHMRCTRCGFKGMVDSQGNLF